jgi:LmbE family N-acetylglucosaminyl deacetylase
VAARQLSVVSVGAHQDDELGCLGTLIRYHQQGWRITTVSVSNGDKGGQHDPRIPHAVIAQTRIEEATRVAGELDGRYFCLGQEDGFVFDSREVRLALAGILRSVEADVVITLPPSDYNNDHVMAGQIALHASLLAAINVIDTDAPPLPRAPFVMHMDTIVGLDFQPTHYVDISDQFAEKARLLRLHDSQMQSQPNITGWDLVTHAEVVGRFRGQQCGVHYAEGFRPVLRTPLLRPGWMLPQ